MKHLLQRANYIERECEICGIRFKPLVKQKFCYQCKRAYDKGYKDGYAKAKTYIKKEGGICRQYY